MNTKFKVGDKVVIVDREDHFRSHKFEIGDIGIIDFINKSSIYTYKVLSGHRSWYCREQDIELLPPEKTGDNVISLDQAIQFLQNLKGSESFDQQVGGSHYKGYLIQPAIFHIANDIRGPQQAIIDYVLRYREKNGVEDLEKAKHWLQMLIDGEKAKG